jgi:hypothetical protein
MNHHFVISTARPKIFIRNKNTSTKLFFNIDMTKDYSHNGSSCSFHSSTGAKIELSWDTFRYVFRQSGVEYDYSSRVYAFNLILRFLYDLFKNTFVNISDLPFEYARYGLCSFKIYVHDMNGTYSSLTKDYINLSNIIRLYDIDIRRDRIFMYNSQNKRLTPIPTEFRLSDSLITDLKILFDQLFGFM